MNKKRPANIDVRTIIRTIKLPVTAIASLLHRITGIFLFLSIPMILWMLSNTLESSSGFVRVVEFASSGLGSLLVWGILSSLSYHLVAGIRHLGMDMGIGESLEVGSITSKLVIVIGVVSAIFWGVWIW